MALPELLTALLRLRPRTMADLEANLAMDLDPEVQRYIFIHGSPDAGAQRDVLIRRIESGRPEAGGLWVVEWRQEPGFLGWCGVFPLEDSGLIELGYRYARSAWGRGVATEAAQAVLEHGFRTLGFDPIVAVTHPDNRASQRVLEKLGFRSEGRRFHMAPTSRSTLFPAQITWRRNADRGRHQAGRIASGRISAIASAGMIAPG